VARSSLGGVAAWAAAFAATTGLAFDGGGFQPVSWDRALVALAAVALAILLLAPAERPGRAAVATVTALGFLTAWTAASWLWSDSPPAALEEAQRTAVYLAGALAVAAAGTRAPLPWVAGGVAAGVVPVAGWNLALRLAPDWTGRSPLRADVGSLADPVGYANALALLDAVGVLLLLGVATVAPARAARLAAAALLVPVTADVALHESAGALVALAAGLAALVLVGERWEAAVLLALPLLGLAAVARERTVVSPPPANLTAAAQPGHRLLLGLALLAVAQVGVAWLALPVTARWARRLRAPERVRVAVAVALVAAAAAAAPFALRGHERSHYWRVAAREAAASPALGTGAGTFVVWWVRIRDAPLSTREAHSLYLETLAELGPLGLLALVTALAAPLAAALRLRRTAWGPPLLAALVAYAVHAGLDFDWELAGVTLPVVLLGAAAAAHASARERAPLTARGRRLGAAATAALAAAGVLALAGNARLASARHAEAAGRFPAAEREARRALRFAPWSAEAWRVIAESRRARGDRAGARAAYRAALSLDRADWEAWLGLAAVSAGAPRRAALAEAARLNPLAASSGRG